MPLKQILEGHRARHRPSGFGFALADSIGYVDAARWDALTKSATWYLSRDALAVSEHTGPVNVKPRYAMIFRGRDAVAAVMMQRVDLSAARVVKEAPSRLRAAALEKIHAPVLVCGNLMSWGFHGVAFAPGEDPSAIWPGVAEAVYRVRRAERLSGETNLVMIKDVGPAEADGARVLKTYGYRAVETEPNMVLDLSPDWRSFDDYLQTLKADYRRSARKIVKDVDTAGWRVERLTDLAPHTARLHDLYRQVQRNARVRPITLPPEFLPAFAAAAGDRFRCTVIRDGADLLGFVTTVKDGETAIGYYIGFDRAAAEKAPIYLRLLLACVADAIDFGCRRLSLGRTALEPKARVGARPEKTHIWLRHRVPLMNVVVRSLLGAVHHDEPPERNPFKEA